MIESGQIEIGPGGLYRATSSTDCELPDYKVVLTVDRRVFVRGDYRGELYELDPAEERLRFAEAAHNDCLEVCMVAVTISWRRVIQ